MDHLEKNKFLNYVPNIRNKIRKQYDLDKPGRMDEAIDLLLLWAKTQTHFQRTDFPRSLLEMLIIHTKGSLERAKQRLDKLCTFRTTMPNLHGPYDVKNDFNDMFKAASLLFLPKMTEKYYRLAFFKGTGDTFAPIMYTQYFRYCRITCEYLMGIDYCDGVLFTLDMREMNVLNFLAHLNLLEFRQMLQFYFGGLGARIKGVHIISDSKMIDRFVKLLHQVLSAKLVERIYVHSNLDSLYKEIPKEILPQEYGGKEKTVLELRDEFNQELESEEFLAYMAKRDQFGVIETARMKDLIDTEYMGLPGTFRTLAVD